MARRPRSMISCLPLSLLLSTIVISSSGERFNLSSNNATTAYLVLEKYNFPVGLLPEGVLWYELDQTTGKFSVYLNGSCSFSLEGTYKLKYSSTISGSISKGRLKNLKGIRVKVLFFWLNIVEVDRKDNTLEFSVGIASSSFPVNNFDESPKCGCGFDCTNETGQIGGLRPVVEILRAELRNRKCLVAHLMGWS